MNLQVTMLLFLFQVIKTLCHVIRKKKNPTLKSQGLQLKFIIHCFPFTYNAKQPVSIYGHTPNIIQFQTSIFTQKDWS